MTTIATIPSSSLKRVSSSNDEETLAKADGSPRRLLIAEEALRDYTGHWFEYVKSVRELGQCGGVDVVTAAHKGLGPTVAEQLNGHGVFAVTSWDGEYAHPQAWRRYAGILRHNLLVYSDMTRFLDAAEPFDCLFAPTVAIHHIGGWLHLSQRRLGRDFDRLVLLFRNNIASYDSKSNKPKFNKTAFIWRRLLHGFKPWLEDGRVCFATDSERLAREYEILSGIRPAVFPSPRVAGFQDRTPKAKDAPFIFGCLGPARFEKGIDLLQEAAKRFLSIRPDANVRFLIQWNQPILLEDGSCFEPDQELAANPRAEFLTGALDSAAYDAAMQSIDCMVLPYRRASYFARISGVAVEAATCGMPIIYPHETWMEDLVESNAAGVGMNDGDIDGLLRALLAIFDGRARYEQLAKERVSLARSAHSGDSFMNALWTARSSRVSSD